MNNIQFCVASEAVIKLYQSDVCGNMGARWLQSDWLMRYPDILCRDQWSTNNFNVCMCIEKKTSKSFPYFQSGSEETELAYCTVFMSLDRTV